MKKKSKKEIRENSTVLKATEKLGEVMGTVEQKLLPSIKDALETSRKEIQKFTNGNLRAFNRGYLKAKKKNKR